MIVSASLHNIDDCPAIDLQMERQIPSKIRRPQNNKTPTRLSGADWGYAKKYENEKEWTGEVNLRFIASCCDRDLFLASAEVR
jgi:hypothetical protein